MVLEVVVGVDDVVLAGVDVLRGHFDAAVVVLHVVAGGGAIEVASVSETTPGGVDLGQVLVGSPVPGLDKFQHPGAVGTGFGTEDAGAGATLISVGFQVG